jgi:hypothetical protein
MTAQTPSSQQQTPAPENKPNDKELNFRMLEARYEKQLAQERAARLEAEKEAQRLSNERAKHSDDDEDDNEPYIDHKKLNKTLAKHGQQFKQETQTEIAKAVNQALAKERQDNWLKSNSDFYDVMQNADKFYEKDPELAETILQMPEGFERQKLVYKSIKAMQLHKPDEKKPSIQEKIDANKKSPYYQPSGFNGAPYGAVGDFSDAGQKNAYSKMQELKNRLRLS